MWVINICIRSRQLVTAACNINVNSAQKQRISHGQANCVDTTVESLAICVQFRFVYRCRFSSEMLQPL